MIAILGRRGPPDEARALRALAAVPYPTPEVATRRIGDALVCVATRPDFVDEELSTDPAMAVALSGRIDNARELGEELRARGAPPVSGRGADVLARALQVYGPDVADRLRGTFAVIATDGRSLWAWRDHIGFRPLFFREDAQAVIVAGESRQVVVAAGIREEPNLEVVEAIFGGGLPSNTLPALQGVTRLAQAVLMTVEHAGTARFRRYWEPDRLMETARISEPDARERFRELLGQAVRRSLTGRDAILLSGGFDSPMVAAYAAPACREGSGRRLGAISAVFPDLPSVDETPYIELVARRYDVELHTYRPAARTLDDLELWTERFATPVPTLSIPEVWEAYSLARRHGYGNVLTGEFAELTFGKWPHILSHLFSRMRFGALVALIQREHRERHASRYGLLLQALTAFVPGPVARAWLARYAPVKTNPLPDWIQSSTAARRYPRTDYDPPPWERWRALQLAGTAGSTLSMEADAICGFIAGVTIRRPLADIDLWEFFVSLPADVKFPVLEWKALARRAMVGIVPDEIMSRRKTVFNAHVMQQVDYAVLERYLIGPAHRFPRVDYALLADRIRQRAIGFNDWIVARELVRAHAFLARY